MTTALHSPADLAESFGVEVRTILEWRRTYGWPCIRVGKQIRFTSNQVEQILARHAIDGTMPSPIAGQTKRSAARRRSA